MLKSWRDKIRPYLLVSIFLAGMSGLAMGEGPITTINIFGISGGETFTAGSATDTVSFLVSNGGQFATAGQPVYLQLLDSEENVVENGISPAYFLTEQDDATYDLTVTFYWAGTVTLKVFGGTALKTTSDFNVVPGAAAKLVVLGPGMDHDPGKNPDPDLLEDGRSGVFRPAEANQPFTVRVILTDNQFNQITNQPTHDISFVAVENVTVPSGIQTLTDGQGSFEATITLPNTSQTIIVQSEEGAGVENGELVVNTMGPPAQEVFPYPSPFNPTQGRITFAFRLESPADAKIIVTDIFGQRVWEQAVSGQQGMNEFVTWDGKNDKGEMVAAGIYYVLFESGGSVESKRRFGVVK